MTAFVISNAGGNWNAAASYVANSGFPIAGDTVTATGTSGNLTVNVNSACASIDFTNYVGTFTINATFVLTTTSTVKLVAGMSIGAAAGGLTFNGTATITSAGKSLPWLLTWGGSGTTCTLADDWTTTGAISLGSTPTINGNTVHAKGSFVIASGTINGTTVFSVEGTSWLASGGVANIPVNLAPSGTLTVAGTITWGTGTLTYVSGTVSFGSSTLSMNGSCTLSLGSSAKLNNMTIASAITITLAANLFVQNTLTLPNTNLTFTGAFSITALGIASATISATRTWTLNIATSIIVTGAITIGGIVGGHAQFVSSSAGTLAVLTLQAGVIQKLYLVDGTDIDSSGGEEVLSIAGTIGANSLNWYNSYPNANSGGRGSALIVTNAGMY